MKNSVKVINDSDTFKSIINNSTNDGKKVQLFGTVKGKSGHWGFLVCVKHVQLGSELPVAVGKGALPASGYPDAEGCITILDRRPEGSRGTFDQLSTGAKIKIKIKRGVWLEPVSEKKGDLKTDFLLTNRFGEDPFFEVNIDDDTHDEATMLQDAAQGSLVTQTTETDDAFPSLKALEQRCGEARVFLDKDDPKHVLHLLRKKKNLILQGPPGTGKTFFAKILARWLTGEETQGGSWTFTQFHQNTTYDDFVYGWRPSKDGFASHEGTFFRFCKKAQAEPQKNFVMIIDEINRGRISAIFGDLLMLIEASHRGEYTELPFEDPNSESGYVTLCVPDNVYLIGCMNMADRSIAVIDYALRRRFAFFTMKPQFGKLVDMFGQSDRSDDLSKLAERIEVLNEMIKKDDDLNEGFCIGHSFLCPSIVGGKEPLVQMVDCEEVLNYELIPLINEYCYEDDKKREEWTGILNGDIEIPDNWRATTDE